MLPLSVIIWSPWIWIAIGTYLLYRYLWRDMDYFTRMGVPQAEGVPIFGHTWKMWKKNIMDEDVEKLKKFGPVWGEIFGFRKVWVISDPDLIKKIFIKDFENFSERTLFFPDSNMYVKKFLTVVGGQEWKDIRAAVSPGFSSGKIKNMSYLMKECSDALVHSFADLLQKGKVPLKKYFGGYTLDVVASCAFGTKIDTLKDPENEFVVHLKNLFRGISESPMMMLPFILRPSILRFLPSFFSPKTLHFYTNVIKAILKSRENQKSNRNDFLDALLESRKQNKKHMEVLDETTIISQCLLFFLAGFETTAATLTYIIYSLAMNPDKQDKLYAEIASLKDEDVEINHESIMQLKYLDACITETLRLYTPGGRAERQAKNTITVDGYTIEKGSSVMVPIYGIQHSEKYFDDPYEFKPERILTMDKDLLNISWMAFGIGPRNCIGMRFALEEIKYAICDLVYNFRFFKADTTPDKLEFKKGIMACILDEVEVGVSSRNYSS